MFGVVEGRYCVCGLSEYHDFVSGCLVQSLSPYTVSYYNI